MEGLVVPGMATPPWDRAWREVRPSPPWTCFCSSLALTTSPEGAAAAAAAASVTADGLIARVCVFFSKCYLAFWQ